MTHLCVMCGKEKETPGRSVCDACHEKGRIALKEKGRPHTAEDLLKMRDDKLRRAGVCIPQYERGDV